MTRWVPVAIDLCVLGCLASAAQAQLEEEPRLEAGEPARNFELTTWLEFDPELRGGPTDIAFVSDGRAVITRQSGEIIVVMPDGRMQNPMAARIEVDFDNEMGLLGVVRDEHDTLYFYASTGNDDADKHKVYRGTLDDTGQISVDLTRSIIGHGLEGRSNHVGGGMIIHEGQLYVSVGDTGYNASPPINRYGTCLNKPNGKILRVNLDGSIPADNPLVSLDAVTGCESPRAEFEMLAPDARIYAWGLRNPWRFWIDPATDLLWIADVGEVTEEEITVGGKGAHHGWPFHEGTVVHGGLGGVEDCTQIMPASPCIAPQYAYGRTEGASVTGGLIPPSGCGWGVFEQRYFFADFESGRMSTLDVEPDRAGAVPGSHRVFAQIHSPVSLRMGPDGAMYIASWSFLQVYRLAPKNVPATCDVTETAAPVRDAGPASDDAAQGDAGCGCRLASRSSSGRAALTFGLALLGTRLALRRRLRA